MINRSIKWLINLIDIYEANKLTNLLEMNPEKISIEKSNVQFFAYDFIIHHENDTIGNILSYLLGKKENVVYSGFIHS